MENKQQQILDEIRSMVVSLRRQVEELESKMAELQSMDDVTEMEVSLDIMDMGIVSEPETQAGQDEVPAQESEPEPVAAFESEDLPEETEVEDLPDETVFEDLPADDDLPFFDEPEVTPVVEEPVTPMAVIDAMIEKQAWRTDMPGTPVRDIRSAISLNDRILFVNYLFNEDPMSFQETLTALNSMTSFDEAVNFVVARHPDWDLESDTVYRFMMALRRRLQ